jgi:putative iron-only hydrogenase system regulator
VSDIPVAAEHRLGVVALFVENRLAAAPKVNAVLSDHAAIVVGRMGIPYRERDLSVVAIIVDGTNDEIGAMTGKLGTIPGVSVKAALRKKNGAEKLEARMTHCSCRGEANEETGART